MANRFEEILGGYSLTIIGISMVIFVLIAITLIATRNISSRFSPYWKKQFLTRAEVVMLSKIRSALKGSEYEVHAQVSMGAIMDVRKTIKGHDRLGLRNKFDRKIIDYVITNKNGQALVLIELDDHTHIASKDNERDRITAGAGYPTLRYRGVRSISPDKLRADIFNAANQ